MESSSHFRIVKVVPLSPEQVDSALCDGGLDPAALPQSFKDILSVPLHLSMLLSLPAEERASVRDREQLFDTFWSEAERRTALSTARTLASQ